MKITLLENNRESMVLNHSWRLSVDQAVAKYFPNGEVESGDSPYELFIIQNDEYVGMIEMIDKKGRQECLDYLSSKYGRDRAKAILGEDDREYAHNESFYR